MSNAALLWHVGMKLFNEFAPPLIVVGGFILGMRMQRIADRLDRSVWWVISYSFGYWMSYAIPMPVLRFLHRRSSVRYDQQRLVGPPRTRPTSQPSKER